MGTGYYGTGWKPVWGCLFCEAKGNMFAVSGSYRKQMSEFIDSLYNSIQKVGGSFSKSDLKQYLSETDSPYKQNRKAKHRMVKMEQVSAPQAIGIKSNQPFWVAARFA